MCLGRGGEPRTAVVFLDPVAGPMELHVQSMVVNGRVGTVLSAYYMDLDSSTAR